jgi:hypothetical protein
MYLIGVVTYLGNNLSHSRFPDTITRGGWFTGSRFSSLSSADDSAAN